MTKQQQVEIGQHIAAGEKVRHGVPITVAEWCALESVSRERWYQAVRRGHAPIHYYNGGTIRIAAGDYIAWVEARKSAREADAERAREAVDKANSDAANARKAAAHARTIAERTRGANVTA